MGFLLKKNYGYGFINDYEVNILIPIGAAPVFTFSTFLSDSKKNEFIQKVIEKKLRFVKPQAFEYGVMVMIGAVTSGQFDKKIPETISIILEILESLEAPKKDICPKTGKTIDEQDSKLVYVTGNGTCARIRLSNEAVELVNNEIEKSNEEFEKAPNNYLKGFCGVLAGAFAGIALTVIFALAGFITAFASIASIFLGVFLYKKFGGKPNTVMIIMSLVTTVVFILGAVTLIYMAAANDLVKEAGLTITNGFKALGYCIKNDSEFKKEFLMDIALNSLFILVGGAYSISSLIKMIKRPKSIQ